jgi:hypothetical protein
LILGSPSLPPWLPVLRVRRLALCDATVDLEFERGSDGETRWRVVDATGRVDVVDAATVATDGSG